MFVAEHRKQGAQTRPRAWASSMPKKQARFIAQGYLERPYSKSSATPEVVGTTRGFAAAVVISEMSGRLMRQIGSRARTFQEAPAVSGNATGSYILQHYYLPRRTICVSVCSVLLFGQNGLDMIQSSYPDPGMLFNQHGMLTRSKYSPTRYSIGALPWWDWFQLLLLIHL